MILKDTTLEKSLVEYVRGMVGICLENDIDIYAYLSLLCNLLVDKGLVTEAELDTYMSMANIEAMKKVLNGEENK